ncbi:MAG: hypothetical protein ACJ76A_06060, partial [Actinomycetota bacterium]
PFEREGVPALGYSVGAVREPAVRTVEVAEHGDAISIGGLQVRLLDEPDVGDLYNFCYAQPDQVPSPPASMEVRGHEVVATWDGLHVLARVTRRDGEPFIRLDGVIRNDRPDHRLRLVVTLPSAATRSLAGAPFELVSRPLIGEGSRLEAASATWPARQVVVAGGVAVLHDGVFEYEVVDGDALAITLLRCVGRISGSFATRPWDAGPRTPTPGAQMIGETSFSLALWPRPPTGAALLEGWERFALPIAEAPAPGGGELPRTGSLLSLDLGTALLSNVRRHDDRTKVRVWNAERGNVTARIASVSVDLGAAEIRTVAL